MSREIDSLINLFTIGEPLGSQKVYSPNDILKIIKTVAGEKPAPKGE